MENLSDYISVLQQAAQTLKDTAADENLQKGAKTIFGWLRGLFQGKSKAQTNLDNFLENPSQTEPIQATLENALDDKQAQELIEQLKTLATSLPQPNVSVSVQGDKNITVTNISGSNIKINQS